MKQEAEQTQFWFFLYSNTFHKDKHQMYTYKLNNIGINVFLYHDSDSYQSNSLVADALLISDLVCFVLFV